MTYEAVRAVASDIDLWLSLLVNLWVVAAVVVFLIRRPRNFGDGTKLVAFLFVLILVAQVIVTVLIGLQLQSQ